MEPSSQPDPTPNVADPDLCSLLLNIMDFLHDDPETLVKCHLLRKEWLPSVQERSFAHVDLKRIKHFRRLKEYFPDPLCSPLTYTRSLSIWPDCSDRITEEDASFIRSSFSRLERLEVSTYGKVDDLTLFHNLSPTVKDLYLGFNTHTPGQVLNLFCSFPLLESLRATSSGRHTPDEEWEIPESLRPPTLTGTLTLHNHGTDALYILSSKLPEHFRFRKIVQEWPSKDDFKNTLNYMVQKCSSTLEWIDIQHPGLVDLSTATKLKGAVFRIDSWGCPEKIAKILDTITSYNEDFEQISIHLPILCFVCPDSCAMDADWHLLINALIRLWNLRGLWPIRLEIIGDQLEYRTNVTQEQAKSSLKRPGLLGVMEGLLSKAWVPLSEGSHEVRYSIDQSRRAF